MSYETLIYEKTGGVGMITINRPTVNNAINARLVDELTEICDNINHDEETRAVIITGSGEKAFCVGMDLSEFSSLAGINQRAKLLSAASPVASLTSPVIAAINGDALGQGLELALACDLRIAAETAHFALPHITSDIIPWDGATQRLPRLIGKAKAMEMILTGETIDAVDAYRIGLVNKVVPPKELIQAVKNMGQAMAAKASLPLKYAKEAIHKGLDLTLEQGLRLEADIYFLLQTTEDRTEGIRAFLEKRHPQFKGK
jgi:enoyl-CoA hydratase/carnithine racemase